MPAPFQLQGVHNSSPLNLTSMHTNRDPDSNHSNLYFKQYHPFKHEDSTEPHSVCTIPVARHLQQFPFQLDELAGPAYAVPPDCLLLIRKR